MWVHKTVLSWCSVITWAWWFWHSQTVKRDGCWSRLWRATECACTLKSGKSEQLYTHRQVILSLCRDRSTVLLYVLNTFGFIRIGLLFSNLSVKLFMFYDSYSDFYSTLGGSLYQWCINLSITVSMKFMMVAHLAGCKWRAKCTAPQSHSWMSCHSPPPQSGPEPAQGCGWWS